MKRAVQAGRSLAFQAFRDKQARPQHTAGHESNISTSTGRMTNQRFVLKSKMMIRNFATTHQLTLEVDTKVLGRSGSRIGGRSGYVFELTEEPGTLYAVLKTTSSAEKWRTRIRLHLSGCKVKNFPKWAMLDKYDAFSLLVGFDPDSAAQTRIVMAAAKLGRWDEYAA